MAGTLTSQTLVNGDRNLVVKLNIAGDADLSASIAVDASAFATSDIKIMRVDSVLNGFSAKLLWDASTDVDIISLSADHDDHLDFTAMGGLINNAGTGKTGDILITTSGIATGDAGVIMLYLKKKNVA